MATPQDFATIQDLEAFWRTLVEDESTRATSLLSYASNYLRQIGSNNSIDIDAKIAADETSVYGNSVKLIVLAAVKRAMLTPTDAPPATQWSQAANPYSESMTFTNPSNDLYFKNNELQLIGLSSISGKAKISILRGVR